jgi:rRNA maturation RNase YbeY
MSLELCNSTRQAIPNKRLLQAIRMVVQGEGYEIATITGVYCGNRMSQRINRDYLNHDYPTDTITFCYSEGKALEGEFYISLDVIRANACRFQVTFEEELLRVTIHSALHLTGMNDYLPEERVAMQAKEDYYLNCLVHQSHTLCNQANNK